MIRNLTLRRCWSTNTTTAAFFSSIQNVTVIGSGTMGTGIGQVAAQKGNIVTLVDTNEAALQTAKNTMHESLKRISKKKFKDDPSKMNLFVEEALGRVTFSTDAHKAVENADLVVEAIVEKLEVKQKFFQDLDKVAPAKTIFTSNTSSFPITEVSELAQRKDRFGGLHFFNPVPMMKLLEIIRINETSDVTYKALVEWGQSIGKVTVVCKDTPGFIVNRLLIPYSLEAMRMVERGDATVEDVDKAMKFGAGYPMGPFELGDRVGLDVGLDIREGMHKRFPDIPLFNVPEILRQKVKEGKLGVKSGEGWYKYSKK